MSPAYKKAIRVLKYLLFTLLFLIALLAGILNTPFAHRIITDKVNDLFARNGLSAHIGELSLLLTGKIELGHLKVKSPSGDTIVYAEKIIIELSPMALFSDRILIQDAKLENVFVNWHKKDTTLLSLFATSTNSDKNENNKRSSWDVTIKKIQLSNIRFQYNDPVKGILIRQTLQNAELTFNSFSLLKTQIDADFISLENADGYLSLVNKNDTSSAVSTPSTWIFSVDQLELKKMSYVFDQPDLKQKTSMSLKHAAIAVNELNLSKRELNVLSLKLSDPIVEFETLKSTGQKNIIEVPVQKDSLKSKWSFICGLVELESGSFNYHSKDSDSFAQWLNIKEFNSAIKEIKYNSSGSGFNVSKISFGLNDQVYLKSGGINLLTDASGKGNLKMQLTASVTAEQQNLFSKNDELEFSSHCTGSIDSLQIEKCRIVSSSGIDVSVWGHLTEIVNLSESRCNLYFQTGKISRDQSSGMIALSGRQVGLPSFQPISYSGYVRNSFLNPEFKVLMQSASGVAVINGSYNVNKMNGKMNAMLSGVQLQKIFGEPYPESVACNISANGGMDYRGTITGNGTVEFSSVLYKKTVYQNIQFDLSVVHNKGTFSLVSSDTNLACNLNGLFGWVKNEMNGKLSGQFNLNKSHANLLPGQISVQGNIAADFLNKGKDMQASVGLKHLAISNLNNHSNIDSILCQMSLSDSSVQSQFHSDFIAAEFRSQSSVDELMNVIRSIDFKNIFRLDSSEFMKLNIAEVMPAFNLTVSIKYDSVFQLFSPDSIFNFDTLRLAISKKEGSNNITGESSLGLLDYSDYKSYGIKMLLGCDSNKINYTVNVDSIETEDKRLGESSFSLDILPASANGMLSISSHDQKPLFQIGAEVLRKNDRVVLKSMNGDWVLNGDKWKLSPDEFLFRENNSEDLSADLHLVHGEMKIELTGRESEKMNLNLTNVRLNALLASEFYNDMPDGLINANVNYFGGNKRKLDFTCDVKDFKWKEVRLDKIVSSGQFEGDSAGILGADISVALNDTSEIFLKLKKDHNESELKYHSEFKKIPFILLQPVLSEYVDSLQGIASGEMDLQMVNERPVFDGEIRLKQVSLNAIKLNSQFHVPEDKLVIRHSRLILDRFTVLDSVQQPLYLSGAIEFENPDSIAVDMNIKTDNLQVMNTTGKDNPNFFGVIIVNSGLNISGPIKQPSVKGQLVLEKGTNITYKYVEDISMKENEKTVTFAKINLDSLANNNQMRLKKISGLPSIQTTIEINPKSIFKIEYSSGFDIDVKVSGKGLLNYSTLQNKNISLAGNYEINNGTSELKFTGWPMKSFSITPGSSIRWDGSYDDPLLNLEAISKVRGSYLNPIDNKDRSVDFIVSMKLLDQLSQLRIIFDVTSNDQYISSVFSSLSSDEVMRQAINLLIFESVDLPGMESSTSYLSAQMSSFWESQLNSLTKTTVKNVDISFGVDTRKQTSSSGAEEEKTSLSYEMERKFFKDRASVKISGRLNDDSQVEGKQSSNLIENFSFEYALDSLNKKYLKIYRKQDYEDILEGEVIKSGVGFIYRKSYHNLSDIWKRKAK